MKEMIEQKKTFSDILKVTISNLIKLFAGVLVGFLLPKIIGVTEYGYYKTFTLYATYVGLFHFGFADGIYLKYGGKDYDELEKTSFRLFSTFLFLLEIIVSVILGLVFVFTLDGELKFIFICLVFFMLSTNITNYYQIISQITKRFNELSTRNVIQSAMICVAVIALWFVHKFSDTILSYRIYTLIYTSISVLLTLWYVFTYRSITFGTRDPFKGNWKLLFSFFILGFPLLVANLCSFIILALDRQFVNILFDTDTYAVYAFAYNMLSLITTALSAISTVIYPYLKRSSNDTLKNNYSNFILVILVLVFGCLVSYFPLCWFVPWFLPKYVDSLPVFRIILPGLSVSSAVTIIMHNFYKTEGKEVLFFIKSVVVLVLSFVANLVAYYLFKTTIAISIASIVIMVIWYYLIEFYFVRKYKVKWIKNTLYIILMSSSFYLITIWSNWWASLLIYIFIFLIATYALFQKEITSFIQLIRKKNSKEVS